ncbi:MAG: hypothetical protein KTR32_30950 [Granulosicoccus sp.]|nr:hypothetical protein [Granulosicoccus sp.]
MDLIKAGRLISALLTSTLCLCSCDSESDRPLISTSQSGDLNLQIPEPLKRMRAVDLSELYAIINIDDDPALTWTEASSPAYDIDVPKGGSLSVSITWYESLTDIELPLAAYTNEWVINSNTTLTVRAEDYTTTGPEFDLDSDNFSNLQERTAGSAPDNELSTPEILPTVRIPSMDPIYARPVIDGVYDRGGTWQENAVFADIYDKQLWINNLLINDGAKRADGDVDNNESEDEFEMRWFAMHDDVHLYIFVLGEEQFFLDAGGTVIRATPERDSSEVWNDHALNIFIDGDRSRTASYDGVDDRHFLIPLITAPDDETNNTSFIVSGASSIETANTPGEIDGLLNRPDLVEFATCICRSDQQTWEIKLNMEYFGIVKDRPFGFDIQLEFDHDGGDRDAKWAWLRESSPFGQDVDDSWFTPSVLGTAIVE